MNEPSPDVQLAGDTTSDAVEITVPSPALQQILQEDETVLLVLRPSPWFVLLDGLGVYLLILIVALFLAWLGHQPWAPLVIPESQVFPFFASLIILRVIWKVLDWANRIYVLTDRRVIRRRGVILLSIVEAPLRRIQHSAIYARFLERIFGLGTIGFATAGSGGFEVVWELIGVPVTIHARILEAIERYGRGPST